MKKQIKLAAILLLLSTLNLPLSTLHAQTTAFTYQGRLNDGTGPANGTYHLRFALFDALTVGNQVGSPLTNAPVNVSNGLFTVALDFGANFTGTGRWLEIGVRTNGGGAFTSLIPRQPITATPYAITAGNLNGALAGTSLSGTYSSPVTLNNAANNFAGSGANLTALNASQLASGTVSDARLSPNVSLLGASIESAEITDGTITPGDLNLTAFNPTFWRTLGNAGTTPGTHFLGTTDNQPLEFKVNNQRGLRLEPTAYLDTVNVIGGSAWNFVGAGVVGATIGGGGSGDYYGSAYTNRVEANFGTVSGGYQNTIQNNAESATIGGGAQNTIQNNAESATTGGGYFNTIQNNARRATIGGGYVNTIQTNAAEASIGGGYGNTIQTDARRATIGGGEQNTIQVNAEAATIGGGAQNMVEPNTISPTIGGGYGNTIQNSAGYATIGGGELNMASGEYATIPGGRANSAASYAFAAGYRAKANHTGAFVWADSTDAAFASTQANQFAIRASGGVMLSDSTPNLSFGNTTRQMLNLWGTQYGIGVQGYTMYSRADVGAGFAWYQGGTHSNAAGDSGGGQTLMSLDSSGANLPGNLKFGTGSLRQMLDLNGGVHGIGVQAWTTYFRTIGGAANGGFAWYKGGVHADNQFDAGGGTELMHLTAGGLWVNTTFVSASDRNLKENFQPVDARAVLDKVAALPLTEWNYKQDPATRHVGPMAQDFHAAFGLGPDDKHIATVDADGVALAAIQGLNQKVEEQRAENAELKSRLVALEKIIAHLDPKGN